jgi:osmotically-inducible protein OsmY
MADSTIRKDVVDELEFDPMIDATGIGVATKDGVVTLTGHVPTYMQRLHAEQAAARVKGVRGVAVELEVRLSSGEKRQDDEIAARALKIIAWMANANDAIQVVVDKGWVKLSGVVEWNYQKQEAERAVRRLSGVLGVTNDIKVHPRVTAQDIRERIAKALRRNADLESAGIKVEVKDSTVTLKGSVKAWRDRRVAENAAWAGPGVTQVRDELTLE